MIFSPPSPNPHLPSPIATPELALLGLCLQSRLDASVLPKIQQICQQSNPDWERLRSWIVQAEVGPLIYAAIRDQSIFPDWLEGYLAQIYQQNACRNVLLLRELETILSAFAKAGIAVLILKGAALVEPIYQDIALRSMSDLDLLVQPEAVATARQILLGLGYHLPEVELQTDYGTNFRNEALFHRAGLIDFYIDLHWKLLSPIYYQAALPSDWFWQTAEPLTIGQSTALTLTVEAQVLYLCAHLALHHSSKGSLWLHDIAEVIHHHPGIRWETVLDRAQQYHLVLPLQQTLKQIQLEWHLKLPSDCLSQLAQLRPSAQESQVFQLLQNPQLKPTIRSFLADWVGTATVQQRLVLLWSHLFPSTLYMQSRYQISVPVLTPFYYPYRWFQALSGLSWK